MIHPSQIKPHMPIVCSAGGQFAVVDHMVGVEDVKVSRAADGKHHYFPLRWVTAVDDKVHVDRPGDQAMRDWSDEPPPSTLDRNDANVDDTAADRPVAPS